MRAIRLLFPLCGLLSLSPSLPALARPALEAPLTLTEDTRSPRPEATASSRDPRPSSATPPSSQTAPSSQRPPSSQTAPTSPDLLPSADPGPGLTSRPLTSPLETRLALGARPDEGGFAPDPYLPGAHMPRKGKPRKALYNLYQSLALGSVRYRNEDGREGEHLLFAFDLGLELQFPRLLGLGFEITAGQVDTTPFQFSLLLHKELALYQRVGRPVPFFTGGVTWVPDGSVHAQYTLGAGLKMHANQRCGTRNELLWQETFMSQGTVIQSPRFLRIFQLRSGVFCTF